MKIVKLEIMNSFEIGKACIRLSFDVSQLEHDRFLVNKKWVSVESLLPKLEIIFEESYSSSNASIYDDFNNLLDELKRGV